MGILIIVVIILNIVMCKKENEENKKIEDTNFDRYCEVKGKIKQLEIENRLNEMKNQIDILNKKYKIKLEYRLISIMYCNIENTYMIYEEKLGIKRGIKLIDDTYKYEIECLERDIKSALYDKQNKK